MRSILTIVSAFWLLALGLPTIAQSNALVQCGAIIESEFTQDNQPQLYTIELSAGDRINTSVEPIGTGLLMTTGLYAPNNAPVWTAGDRSGAIAQVIENPQMVTEPLSANGTYTILVHNSAIWWRSNLGDNYPSTDDWYGGIGVYTLYLGCTLRDGTIIEPGENLVAETSEETGDTSSVPQPEFTGFGFPGLASVDMSNLARIPMSESISFTGAVTPTGGEILGYTFNGTTNQLISLSVERLSGNLNLGVAVIDNDSNVMHFSALTASEGMTSRLRIPIDGEYIIGVFRLDLRVPETPEATAFSVQIEIME